MDAQRRTVLRTNRERMPRHAASRGLAPVPILRTVPPWPGRPRLWTLTALAGALLLAGCTVGPGEPSAETTPTLPAGVTVELWQLRADVAVRQAQLRVSNDSSAAVRIGEVRVDDPRFDAPATRLLGGRVSAVPPGDTVDIRVQLPAVDCSATDEASASAVLEIIGDSGASEYTASAPDPLGFVGRLHARECLLERVSDAATLAFTGFEAGGPGVPAALELTVTPTGAGAATIAGIEGTNLIDVEGARAGETRPLGIEVSADDRAPVVVEVPITPFRCDPHAVQEDKRGTIFTLWVQVDGEAGEVELFVGEEMRGDILTWVAAWCGFGS